MTTVVIQIDIRTIIVEHFLNDHNVAGAIVYTAISII